MILITILISNQKNSKRQRKLKPTRLKFVRFLLDSLNRTDDALHCFEKLCDQIYLPDFLKFLLSKTYQKYKTHRDKHYMIISENTIKKAMIIKDSER